MDVFLNDLLGLTADELSRTRVRLNTWNGEKQPIEVFKRDPKELLGWNFWNSRSYKAGQIAIGLVDMHNGRWLLFTVDTVTKILLIPRGTGVGCEYEPVGKCERYFGRVVVSYHNSTRSMFRKAGSIMGDLKVLEILPAVYSGDRFPGYENVSLTYDQLKTIIDGKNETYWGALENRKGVYVIADTSDGTLYVGSATSERGMLLARWSSYAENGTGGDQKLEELKKEKGFDHIKRYFRFTILETYNRSVDDAIILSRESYWKIALDTRKNGYNAN